MKGRAGLSIVLMMALSSCTGNGTRTEGVASEGSVERSIEEVQEAFTPEWMELPGVVGTGIGLCEGQPCIKVFVAGPTRQLEERIPSEVEGYQVVLEQTGEFQALDTLPDS